MHPITHPGIPANMNRPMDRPSDTDAAARPGKSAQSVGHMAKAAVAAAAEAGIELPSNAQGVAASAIAGGADPALIFAVQTEDPAEGGAATPVSAGDEPVAPEGAEETAQVAAAPVGDQPAVDDGADRLAAELAEAGFTAAADLIAAAAASPAETALELLSDAEDNSA